MYAYVGGDKLKTALALLTAVHIGHILQYILLLQAAAQLESMAQACPYLVRDLHRSYLSLAKGASGSGSTSSVAFVFNSLLILSIVLLHGENARRCIVATVFGATARTPPVGEPTGGLESSKTESSRRDAPPANEVRAVSPPRMSGKASLVLLTSNLPVVAAVLWYAMVAIGVSKVSLFEETTGSSGPSLSAAEVVEGLKKFATAQLLVEGLSVSLTWVDLLWTFSK